MSIPAPCRVFRDEIDELRQERDGLQDELQRAAPGEKPALVRLIRALNLQIAGRQNELTDCIATTPQDPPPPPPIEAILTGTATLSTTDTRAPGPYTSPVRLGLIINGNRTIIAITSFPTISTPPFDTPIGLNSTRVTHTGGGTGSYAGGAIVMPITLHLDHSIDIPIFEEDSDISLVLSTQSPGSPVTPEPFGSVTLVGSGTFSGGILAGSTGMLRVSGNIAAAVAATVPDVREERAPAAGGQVIAAGLLPRFTGANNGSQAWVFSQSPSAGTVVSRGDTVSMLLRTGPIP